MEIGHDLGDVLHPYLSDLKQINELHWCSVSIGLM